MAAYDEDTAEFKTEQAFSEHFFACYEPQLELRPAAATHVGKVRHRNEDHHAVIRHTRSREVLFTNLPKEDLAFLEDEAYGMVVADGIGGAARGDLASRLALRTMFELAGRATSWVMKITDLDAQEIHQRVEAYVSEIQRTLRSYSDGDPELAEMGTTWTSGSCFRVERGCRAHRRLSSLPIPRLPTAAHHPGPNAWTGNGRCRRTRRRCEAFPKHLDQQSGRR